MTKYPRLHVDQPEPPAPLPFPGRRAGSEDEPGSRRGFGGVSDEPTGFDAAREATASIDRVQETLNRLRDLNEETIASFPFPSRDDDDDGPWAA